MRVTSLIAAAAAVSFTGLSAFAAGNVSVSSDVAQFFGTLRQNASGTVAHMTDSMPGPANKGGNPIATEAVIYDNTGSAAIGGFSQLTSTAPIYGDTMTLADTGRLDEIAVTLFNSSSGGNTGVMSQGTMVIKLYDNTTPYPGSGAITNPLVGTLNVNVDMSASPLPAGFYTYIDIFDLAPLGIDIPATQLLVTQQWSNGTGSTSLRNGIVNQDPVTVGSSPNTLIFGNSANPLGLYTLGTPAINANPGTFIYVPEPASLSAIALGLPLFIRRRKA